MLYLLSLSTLLLKLHNYWMIDTEPPDESESNTWIVWGVPGSAKCCFPPKILRTCLKSSTCRCLRELDLSEGRRQRINIMSFFVRSWIEVQLTSWPHSRKMKGIRFPELPMITSSGKALHSYPSMSIFKITSSASMLAWLERCLFVILVCRMQGTRCQKLYFRKM